MRNDGRLREPRVLLSAFAVLVGGAAAADEIVLPKSPERNQPAEFAYRFDRALTGSGSLDVEWRDFVGRMVERRRIPLNLADVAEVVFSLDPYGGTIAHYSGNLLTAAGLTTDTLPLAFNDKTGVWKLRATDLPSGGTATAELQVDP